MGCLASSGLFLSSKSTLIQEKGVLGGQNPNPPSLISRAEGAELSQPAALGGDMGGAVLTPIATNDADVGGYPGASLSDAELVESAEMKDPGTPVGPAFDRSGVISYAVQKGDTLSKIAAYFGISVDTIASANHGVKTSSLKVGQKLNILPTSGVVYDAVGGDTLASISNTFGISQNEILQFNHSVNFGSLDPGTPIIIPGGKDTDLLASAAALPNYNNEFVIPTNGYNPGILQHYNAVDIANSCGTPVVAAAEGLVVPDDNIPQTTDGWNGGYGNFVLIEHPFGNNVLTRYAYLEKVLVQVGDYVKQGQVIGLTGETGEAAGCHVHFEVYGAQNPFVKS